MEKIPETKARPFSNERRLVPRKFEPELTVLYYF